MSGSRCAVAILPAPGGDAERAAQSVQTAADAGRGDFAEVLLLSEAAGDDPHRALLDAAKEAEHRGCDWLFAVSAAETVVPDIFSKTAPALRLHDAVWGGAGTLRPDAPPLALERITRLAAQDYRIFFHLALRWWIGPAHFIRPALALRSAPDPTSQTAWADYLLAVWRGGRAFKGAHALTMFHGPIPTLDAANRGRLLAALDKEPIFNIVRFGAVTARLPYTGRNPVIERDHTRGEFFEQSELAWLHDALPSGMRIVDAGANTGNHTVFFAAAMKARSVVPIEPDPRACQAIRTAADANHLGKIDLRFLGTAVGRSEARMSPVYSEGGGLGATRLISDPAGSIPVRPLDALGLETVDLLKIDVEGMEMDVLAGAVALIARDRPAIFIEVLDTGVSDFLAWVDNAGYRIEKLFPDKTHSNYFVVPAEKPNTGA